MIIRYPTEDQTGTGRGAMAIAQHTTELHGDRPGSPDGMKVDRPGSPDVYDGAAS